jgi:two-component system phosphate regulon sensor histidine kinase PhoR
VADEDIRHRAEELKRTVVELEETKHKLEVVSKARSEFIDVVSHQFRTPLSSIRWNSELLVDAAVEAKFAPEYREALENMRTKSVYLIETLDRVFATLDIDTEKMVLDIKSGFFWETVQDSVESYRKDLDRKGIKLKFVRPKNQPAELDFDKAKMSAALHIVLGNAINYGKDAGKIEIAMAQHQINGLDYQTCTVTDDGVGLDQDDETRIMEKFFRSKPAVLKVADGTGLGMYIVKHYVEAHRGILKVDSPGLGKGTSVTLALPMQKPA